MPHTSLFAAKHKRLLDFSLFLSLTLSTRAIVMTVWKSLSTHPKPETEVCRHPTFSSPSPLEALESAGSQLVNRRPSPVKSPSVENIVVDEAHERTYVVMAHRVLTDGELYKSIRLEIMKRGSPLAKGGRLVIVAAKE
jgi:hypothetical protein